MSEWKNIKTAPKDGTYLYLADEKSKCTSGYYNEGSWYDTNKYYIEPKPVLWCELPEPPEKKHRCYGFCCVCHSSENKLFFDLYKNEELVDDFFRVRVKYCPFCGEEA